MTTVSRKYKAKQKLTRKRLSKKNVEVRIHHHQWI